MNLAHGSCQEPLTLALVVFKSLELGLTNGNDQGERITFKAPFSPLEDLGLEVLGSCLRPILWVSAGPQVEGQSGDTAVRCIPPLNFYLFAPRGAFVFSLTWPCQPQSEGSLS